MLRTNDDADIAAAVVEDPALLPVFALGAEPSQPDKNHPIWPDFTEAGPVVVLDAREAEEEEGGEEEEEDEDFFDDEEEEEDDLDDDLEDDDFEEEEFEEEEEEDEEEEDEDF